MEFGQREQGGAPGSQERGGNPTWALWGEIRASWDGGHASEPLRSELKRTPATPHTRALLAGERCSVATPGPGQCSVPETGGNVSQATQLIRRQDDGEPRWRPSSPRTLSLGHVGSQPALSTSGEAGVHHASFLGSQEPPGPLVPEASAGVAAEPG